MKVNRLINYIDENGKIVVNHLVNSFLIKSEEDLSVLTNAKCPPGTQAYLIDESKIWELDTNYEWKLKVHKDTNSEVNNFSGSYMIVEIKNNSLNKTWQEICDAISNGKVVFVKYPQGLQYISRMNVHLNHGGSISVNYEYYTAQSPDDYPVFEEQ